MGGQSLVTNNVHTNPNLGKMNTDTKLPQTPKGRMRLDPGTRNPFWTPKLALSVVCASTSF